MPILDDEHELLDEVRQVLNGLRIAHQVQWISRSRTPAQPKLRAADLLGPARLPVDLANTNGFGF